MIDYAKKLERIERMQESERDPVKRWHYKKILKETIRKIESMGRLNP